MLGYEGEVLAAHYLQSKGYQILKNNFTVRGGEIDIIAKQGDLLIFVEVKTRTSIGFGSGEESVNAIKKKRLHKAIRQYLLKTRLEDCDYRLDIIDVELDQRTKSLKNIEHFQDVEYD